uniref:Parathyroid hormone n=1 Tax=Leptobrachium leishanense TaxID=445787 RepID=A0A8C5PRK9_9ANUR
LISATKNMPTLPNYKPGPACLCPSNPCAVPCRRRAVGEMQLMHNYGDFVHSLQRQDWLDLQLQSLYTASMSTPQEFTPKVTESKPQKPLKKENRPKQVPHLSQRVNPKTSHRHGVKPNANNFLKPDIP